MAMNKRFTGWHMTAIMVGFFAIVIAVNLTMARLAIGTFGGTIVDNSYVASQKFNGWLAKADKQAALGWSMQVALQEDRHVRVSLHDKAGAPIEAARLASHARHPLGRMPAITLSFDALGNGQYASREALPLGRWDSVTTAIRGGDSFKQLDILR